MKSNYRIKLKYKFFITFLILSLFILGLMAGVMQFFIYRNFAEFVNNSELDRLDAIVLALQEIHMENNSWGPLKTAPRLWHMVLQKGRPEGAPMLLQKGRLEGAPTAFYQGK